MIIVCPSCSSRYKFDETKLGTRPSARTKCAKCGGTIEIENPAVGAFTLPPGALPPTLPKATVTTPLPPPPTPKAPATATTSEPKVAAKKVPTQPDPDQTSTGRDLVQAGILELPKDRRYSLAVLQGPSTGTIFPIAKVRTTIGRAGADILIEDPEASRIHAAIEILGDHAIIRDLGSTNGTFVELEKIEQHVIYNHAEFRIGSHVLMLIVTEVE